MLHRILSGALLLATTLAVPAAVVRGRVTTALGVPAPGARVQLIRLNGGARSVAESISGPDGSYEIRTGYGGHFLLLVSPPILSNSLAPQIGVSFYVSRNDLRTMSVALNPEVITPESSALPTGIDTPLAQLATPVAQIWPTELLSSASLLPELQSEPGVFTVALGPAGNPVSLYLRGAAPTETAVTIEGVSAEDLGGGFNLSTLSATGFDGPQSAPSTELAPISLSLAGVDADASTLALHTVRAYTVRSALVYSGDAGPLDTVRNQATASVSPGRADLLASFSRFDTANENPAVPFHLATAAANLGYSISAGTSLRATARRDVASGPLPSPFGLFALQPAGKDAAQNLYASFVFQTCTSANWCNALRYGLVRKRAQSFDSSTSGSGLPVTVRGANGYTASGTAIFASAFTREDQVTDRDEFMYDSSYRVKPYLGIAFHAAYNAERGAHLLPFTREVVERQHILAALSLQGQFLRRRLFYEASGFLDHSNLLQFTGAPRAGLGYAAVRPGSRKFRGTVLHVDASAGLREPSLLEQIGTTHPASPTLRTLEVTADQTILPGKLTLRATYFHSQFAHEFELLALRAPSQTLAFRTQGLVAETRLQPTPHLLFLGSYTYLASLVEQSAAVAVFNPAYAAVPVGALTALPGARPFHRPPNSGSASVQYSGRLLSAGLRAAFAGRSDDSTNLPQSPALLLPNRNLSPGYTALNADVSFTVTHRITVYSNMTNLLGIRHIAPIGFTSTPFVARTGLRIRLGGE
jgi:vitamin B12 transporter